MFDPIDLIPIGMIAGGLAKIPGKITGFAIGRDGLRHGLHRAIGRDGHGVHPRAILDALNNPTAIIEQANGRFVYVGENASVQLNKASEVVTTWATSRRGWRF